MPEQTELPSGQPVTRVLAMPSDTNPAGDIFGGWLMAQVDIAGGIIASRQAGGRVVTVAVNSFEFHEPVYVGDLLSCYGEVTNTGRTSLTIRVEAFAADMTFVAVDDRGKPRHLPEA